MMRNEECWYKDVCELECTNSCIRYAEMKFLMDNSGIPKNKQIPVTLIAGDDYDAYVQLAHIKDGIADYVANGNNLYICSTNTGNGKTSWAIKLLLKYFHDVWAGNGFRVRGKFVHVPTLLNRLKNFENPISQEYRDDLVNADLVVWDDIAAVPMSNYDNSQLLSLIDQRVIDGKSNIYTGNLTTHRTLEEMIGSRLASRVYNNSDVIEFKGKDRRGERE